MYRIGRHLGVSVGYLPSHPLAPEERAVVLLDAWAKEFGREATCLKLAQVLFEQRMYSVLDELCKQCRQEGKTN